MSALSVLGMKNVPANILHRIICFLKGSLDQRFVWETDRVGAVEERGLRSFTFGDRQTDGVAEDIPSPRRSCGDAPYDESIRIKYCVGILRFRCVRIVHGLFSPPRGNKGLYRPNSDTRQASPIIPLPYPVQRCRLFGSDCTLYTVEN